jgi:hypothetical protein
MTPAAAKTTKYGGLTLGELVSLRVSIRAITRSAPASVMQSSRSCCRP